MSSYPYTTTYYMTLYNSLSLSLSLFFVCVFIAEEEDFRRYCASLFAVPVSRSRTEPQTTTTESCVIIEVMDEVKTPCILTKIFHLLEHTVTEQMWE